MSLVEQRRCSRWCKLPLVLALVGVWADAVSTHIALQRPGAYESNPLVAPWVNSYGIWPVAVVLTATLLVVGWRTYFTRVTPWVFDVLQLLLVVVFFTRVVAVILNLRVAAVA